MTEQQYDKLKPELAEQLRWMKERLGLNTDEELISKALSLLHQAIEWEDRGYRVGAFTEPGLLEDRKFVAYQISSKK